VPESDTEKLLSPFDDSTYSGFYRVETNIQMKTGMI